MAQSKVLVTGAGGFIAKHCIAELLRQGFAVRGTLRDLTRADEVKIAVGRAGVDASAVELVRADLNRHAGWDAAVEGCEYVMHVASPFPIEQPSDRQEIIAPARDGTLRVLSAATQARARRVVMTSSVVAVTTPTDMVPDKVYDESDWTDPDRPDATPYMQSKTLAERAAWDFVRNDPNAPDLVVINPSFVQGPALDGDLSTSLEVLRLMALGTYPAAPKVGFPATDVRDVAELHVAALRNDKAVGERFICSNGHLTLYELGQILAHTLPELKSKVPRFELPDWSVRMLAMVDRKLASVLPELGNPRHVSNAKAAETFGKTFRPAHEAVRDAALSLRGLGII